MKIVAQRVLDAAVDVVALGVRTRVGSIDAGLLVYLGVGQGDTEADAEKIAAKLLSLRVFTDIDSGKMTRSVCDVGGAILVVSQFTLYGDLQRGNRPSFVRAAPPAEAERLYEYVVSLLARAVPVQTGKFGADMRVCSTGDGPVTILYETEHP